MGLNLQTIEDDLLKYYIEAGFDQKFLALAAAEAEKSPIVILGTTQFARMFPAAMSELTQMKNVITDSQPDFQAKLSPAAKVIFANVRVRGIDYSEEHQWFRGQHILPKETAIAPMQQWFGEMIRANGEAWLKEAHDHEYQKKISYVVLSGFDNIETLTVMMKSFCEFTEARDDNELIVVLNGYTRFPQEAIDAAMQRGFSVKTVFRNKNVGIGLGFNEGLRIANGQYICILQDDITFSQHAWDKELAGYLDEHKNIGIMGGYCPIYSFTHPNKSLDASPYRHRHPAIRGYTDWPLLKQAVVEADMTVCICMMIRRELAEYDWRWAPTGVEDLALCMEARVKGYDIFVTDIGIEHAMIKSVIRGDLDRETRKSENLLGMPILRAFHYPHFRQRYAHLLRPVEDFDKVTSMDEMAPLLRILPKVV